MAECMVLLLCAGSCEEEAEHSLDSTMMADGEDEYAAEPVRLRCSSRQRRTKKWGDEDYTDWGAQKASQSDDYSDEGHACPIKSFILSLLSHHFLSNAKPVQDLLPGDGGNLEGLN